MTTPTTDPVQTDFEGEEMREKIVELIRRHVYADATGLSPAVIGYHLGGFEAAADAVLAALRSTPEAGDQGAWKRTGAGTCSINGSGGTTEWFRASDGQVRSYPFGFDPNVGAYVGMSFRSTPQPQSHTEEAGEL